MGGWRDDGPSPGPSPGRRRGEPRRSFSSRSGGSGEAWRDAIRPVKSAAAKGVNSADALRVAVRNFLDDSCGIGTGFLRRRRHPSRHRLRRPAPHARREPPPGHPPGRTLGEAFDALLGHLLTAGKIAPDAEVAPRRRVLRSPPRGPERVHRQRQRRPEDARARPPGGRQPRATRRGGRALPGDARASETRRATCLATRSARSARW